MDSSIFFQSQETTFRLPEAGKVRQWLNFIIVNEGGELGEIYITFTSDEGLLQINRDYLQHDYYTDIITFPYHEPGMPLHSDIFISRDRAKENAKAYKNTALTETHRLMAHGLLHMLGFNDHSEVERKEMRENEDKYLSLRSKFGLKG